MNENNLSSGSAAVFPRQQQTLSRSVRLTGFGLFRGLDVNLELCPAPEDFGIRFCRTDLQGRPEIPAHVDYVAELPRRTALAKGEATVETTEHLLAALAACRIDNCLIRINSPEVPTLDGSSLEFLEAIDRAGVLEQAAPRPYRIISETIVICDGTHVGIAAQPPQSNEYNIGYVLDYGPGPIPPQALKCDITPENFRNGLAFSRTFALEEEVRQLRCLGLGLRATASDVVVFGQTGVIDNSLRAPDECVRHKILDCIGDFALAGCDLYGRFTALRSGHRLNHELVRRILQKTVEQRQLRSHSGPASHSTSSVDSNRMAG